MRDKMSDKMSAKYVIVSNLKKYFLGDHVGYWIPQHRSYEPAVI